MKAMSNVDVYAICSELKKSLMDARFQKAYQPTKDTVLIRYEGVARKAARRRLCRTAGGCALCVSCRPR